MNRSLGSRDSSRIALALTGLGFIGFGLGYAFWPLPMARLTEIPLPTPTARIDFAATYGGLQLGFGCFLLICARRSAWTEPGLWAAVAALGGLVLVRLATVTVLGNQPGRSIWAGLAIESGAALANAGALALFRHRSSTPATRRNGAGRT